MVHIDSSYIKWCMDGNYLYPLTILSLIFMTGRFMLSLSKPKHVTIFGKVFEVILKLPIVLDPSS